MELAADSRGSTRIRRKNDYYLSSDPRESAATPLRGSYADRDAGAEGPAALGARHPRGGHPPGHAAGVHPRPRPGPRRELRPETRRPPPRLRRQPGRRPAGLPARRVPRPAVVAGRPRRLGHHRRHPRRAGSGPGDGRAPRPPRRAVRRPGVRPRLQPQGAAVLVPRRPLPQGAGRQPVLPRRRQPGRAGRGPAHRPDAGDGRLDHRAGGPGDDAPGGHAVDDRPGVR
jgi:hypothetical protein